MSILRSESIKTLAVALKGFQHEVQKISKTEDNPFFKSKYADLPAILDAIREPLANNGLSFAQFPTGENEMTTILMHESGEFLQGTFKMTPSKNDPQGQGSVITYQRRYALSAILGLNTDEDDDGNAASQPRNGQNKANQNGQAKPKPLAIQEEEFQALETEVKAARDLDELQEVWNKYEKYHNHPAFKGIVNNHKKFLAEYFKNLQNA